MKIIAAFILSSMLLTFIAFAAFAIASTFEGPWYSRYLKSAGTMLAVLVLCAVAILCTKVLVP